MKDDDKERDETPKSNEEIPKSSDEVLMVEIENIKHQPFEATEEVKVSKGLHVLIHPVFFVGTETLKQIMKNIKYKYSVH